MSDTQRQQRVDVLVLARLARASGKWGPVPSAVAQSVARYQGDQLPARAKGDEVRAAIASLIERGLLTETRKLTEDGQRWLCEQLHVSEVPTWRTTSTRLLPILGLGLTPGTKDATRSSESANIAAVVVAEHHDLPITRPTTASVLNALAARALDTKRTVRNATDVRAIVAERWINGDDERPTEPNGAASQQRVSDHGPTGEPSPEAGPPLSDEELARLVLDTAASETSGRFGDRKVFVSAIHRRLASASGPLASRSLDEFKHDLVRLNERRLVTLARADFVAAMDNDEVEASHIRDLNRDFHFVLDDATWG